MPCHALLGLVPAAGTETRRLHWSSILMDPDVVRTEEIFFEAAAAASALLDPTRLAVAGLTLHWDGVDDVVGADLR